MKRCFIALMLAFSLVSCVNEEFQAAPDVQAEAAAQDALFAKGECIVLFSDEMVADIEATVAAGSLRTKSADMNLLMEEFGVTSMERLFPHAGQFEPRTRKEGLHKWYILKYDENVPFTKAGGSFENIPGVEYVEPVRAIKMDEAYNDLTDELWGLDNKATKDFDINVLPVWENYTMGNSDVIVSVVDNGVDIKHEDLAANCLTTGHYNAVDNNSNITAGSHGTHVAGTIAAVGNNGKGIIGVAGGNAAKGKGGVKIMSCQIFKETASGTASGNSARAITWGADHGAVISQNSWGYQADANGDGTISSEELKVANSITVLSSDKAAIDYFIKYAGCDNEGNQLPGSPMKGGIVIFAAGNDALANGAPANYEPVVAVGSVAMDGSKSSFSNYGPWVDIAAPGSSIKSTVPDNQYGVMNGTSMACPHVSGVAALIVSHFGGPGFTNEMLKAKLLGGSNKQILPSSYQIGGLLDAYGAMVYGDDEAPAQVNDLEIAVRANTLDCSWTVTADTENKPAYGFLFLYSTDRKAVEEADASNYSNVGYSVCTPELAKGEKATYSLKGLEFSKEYFVKVLAFSYGRNHAEASEIVTVNTLPNNAPVLTSTSETTFTMKASETIEIPVVVSEPDGHEFAVNVTNGSAAETFTKTHDGNWRLTIVGNGAPEGTYTAVVVAEDEYGMSGSLKIQYTIRENRKPEVIKEVDNILLTAKGKEFKLDMSEYITDPDEEQLKYDINISNSMVVHINPKGSILYGTALDYGTVDVKVTAKDARGEQASVSFKVLVKDPSKPLSVYPNPVTDFVNVATLDMAETTIRITNATGQTVHEQTSQVSGVEPARIDMTGCVPGVYSVFVSFGGNDYKETIVKL